MTFDSFLAFAEMSVSGHIFNWRPAQARRAWRHHVVERVVERYFSRYVPVDGAIAEGKIIKDDQNERVFTMWLQGEEQAPAIVKECFRTMRERLVQPVELLDEKTLHNWIELPDFVMDKWRRGKMRAAHFSDIARVELLYQHGGIWLDSTCFVTAPIPQQIIDQDFFMYLSGTLDTFTLIQNCFIRGRRGSWLLEAWRQEIFDYWRNEPKVFSYYTHHYLFREMVKRNDTARRLFGEMLQLPQDPSHAAWYFHPCDKFTPELWERITGNVWFQKTSYKPDYAVNPPAGSVAEAMISGRV